MVIVSYVDRMLSHKSMPCGGPALEHSAIRQQSQRHISGTGKAGEGSVDVALGPVLGGRGLRLSRWLLSFVATRRTTDRSPRTEAAGDSVAVLDSISHARPSTRLRGRKRAA